MTFYAHSTEKTNRSDWQSLPGHLEAVAELAEGFGKPIGIGRAARLAGLLHDLGKYTPAFQARLAGSKERVDHSSAGAAIVSGLTNRGDDAVIAELAAYAIAGHHAGLPDKGSGTFGRRMARFGEPRPVGHLRSEILVYVVARWRAGRPVRALLGFLGLLRQAFFNRRYLK